MQNVTIISDILSTAFWTTRVSDVDLYTDRLFSTYPLFNRKKCWRISHTNKRQVVQGYETHVNGYKMFFEFVLLKSWTAFAFAGFSTFLNKNFSRILWQLAGLLVVVAKLVKKVLTFCAFWSPFVHRIDNYMLRWQYEKPLGKSFFLFVISGFWSDGGIYLRNSDSNIESFGPPD